MTSPPHDSGAAARPGPMADVLERNIHALLERRRSEVQARPRSDRVADAITAFTGSMRFVYLHIVIFGVWIVINLPFSPWRFDPSFVVLAMAASVEAIFLSTFVLITQNRTAAVAEKRADLDVQISLLAEHEVTQLLRLVTQIAERMGVDEARQPTLEELKLDVQPEAVLDRIEHKEGEPGRSGKPQQPRPGSG